MMTEDGIVYDEGDLYCPECGDIYAPTVDYCDATLRCTGVDLLPVDKMFAQTAEPLGANKAIWHEPPRANKPQRSRYQTVIKITACWLAFVRPLCYSYNITKQRKQPELLGGQAAHDGPRPKVVRPIILSSLPSSPSYVLTTNEREKEMATPEIVKDTLTYVLPKAIVEMEAILAQHYVMMGNKTINDLVDGVTQDHTKWVQNYFVRGVEIVAEREGLDLYLDNASGWDMVVND